ncbi:MAG: DUF5330 domain-containing protein [Methyloligella sp. ZOD6]
MFLIRMAFWIIVVILLLPTDRDQQSDVLGTAQAAVKDISGFCTRNPDVCVKSQDYFEIFVQKAQFGADMVMNFIDERSGDSVEVPPVYEAEPGTPAVHVEPQPQNVLTPARKEEVTDKSQNTLKPADLSPGWRAPQDT